MCCPKQRHLSKFLHFYTHWPIVAGFWKYTKASNLFQAERFTVTGRQSVLQNSTLAVVAYTKTKYFLSPFVPMCRIKMKFDKSSLWCVRLCVTKVYTSQQCFTEEGYTYFLIHRTRFEFSGIVSWHKPFPSFQRVSKGCKAPRSSNDLNVGMRRNVTAVVQTMVMTWLDILCHHVRQPYILWTQYILDVDADNSVNEVDNVIH